MRTIAPDMPRCGACGSGAPPTSQAKGRRLSPRAAGLAGGRTARASPPQASTRAHEAAIPSRASRARSSTERGETALSPRGVRYPSERTRSVRELGERDGLDLDQRPGRQLGHLDRRARGRAVADVLRVDLVHRLEVAEILQEHRRLDEPVEPAAGLLEDRAKVGEDLLGLLLDAPRDRAVAGLETKLAGDEDEAAGGDRLRVRRALERRRGSLGADDGLLAHYCTSRSQAWRNAPPSDLKIASSTCPLSVPFSSRTWRTRPACSANCSRKRRATSEARPPIRASVRSTFVTKSGASLASSTTNASASAEVSDPMP